MLDFGLLTILWTGAQILWTAGFALFNGIATGGLGYITALILASWASFKRASSKTAIAVVIYGSFFLFLVVSFCFFWVQWSDNARNRHVRCTEHKKCLLSDPTHMQFLDDHCTKADRGCHINPGPLAAVQFFTDFSKNLGTAAGFCWQKLATASFLACFAFPLILLFNRCCNPKEKYKQYKDKVSKAHVKELQKELERRRNMKTF